MEKLKRDLARDGGRDAPGAQASRDRGHRPGAGPRAAGGGGALHRVRRGAGRARGRHVRGDVRSTGRGLAAPQVGLSLRLFVMDAGWREGAPEPRAFVNPEVAWASEETETREEGCLSIPDRLVRVARPARVGLRWRGLDGAPHEGSFEGFAAACVQHEIDHLDGVLCIDRAAP
jgi:peptide deformylase